MSFGGHFFKGHKYIIESICPGSLNICFLGGSSSRKAVTEFRRKVINLFREQLPQHIRPVVPGSPVSSGNSLGGPWDETPHGQVDDSSLSTTRINLPLIPGSMSCENHSRLLHKQRRNIAEGEAGQSDIHHSRVTHANSNLFEHKPAAMHSDVGDRWKAAPKIKISESPTAGVPVIENVCHHLAQRVAELFSTETSRPKVILVGRGKYNPIHKMHLRHFVIARQYLEERTRFSVLGGLLIPKHATEVRQRCRTRPREIIPPRHRLAMARAAVGGSPWLTVDSWEITRRRILDYLSTLDHVRQLFEQRFPELTLPVRFVLLVAPDQLLRLNLEELRDAGHECITVCRPQEHERLLAQMGTRWRHVAHVVEDNALLSADLESTSSSKLRQALITGRLDAITPKVPGAVRDYIKRHHIAEKMAGKEAWAKWDKEFADGEVRFVFFFSSQAQLIFLFTGRKRPRLPSQPQEDRQREHNLHQDLIFLTGTIVVGMSGEIGGVGSPTKRIGGCCVSGRDHLEIKRGLVAGFSLDAGVLTILSDGRRFDDSMASSASTARTGSDDGTKVDQYELGGHFLTFIENLYTLVAQDHGNDTALSRNVDLNLPHYPSLGYFSLLTSVTRSCQYAPHFPQQNLIYGSNS